MTDCGCRWLLSFLVIVQLQFRLWPVRAASERRAEEKEAFLSPRCIPQTPARTVMEGFGFVLPPFVGLNGIFSQPACVFRPSAITATMAAPATATHWPSWPAPLATATAGEPSSQGLQPTRPPAPTLRCDQQVATPTSHEESPTRDPGCSITHAPHPCQTTHKLG